MLYLRDPAEGGIYPPCPFRAMTGYDCPVCGTGRALHNVLHGRLADAFSLNPLALLLLPVVAYVALSAASFVIRGRPLHRISMPAWVGWTAAALAVGFAVARNLPFDAVAWMASYR